MQFQKKIIIGGMISVFLLSGVGFAKMPKRKVMKAVKQFCSVYPKDPTCQDINKIRKKIGIILKEMKTERDEMCKKYPEEPFCKHVKEIRELRKQERDCLKEIKAKIKAECDKNPAASFCP